MSWASGGGGYVQLWFFFKKVITAAECGAAFVLTLEDRQTQLGNWGRCHAVYIRMLDINHGMKWWEHANP
jgi:hypothetical protein